MIAQSFVLTLILEYVKDSVRFQLVNKRFYHKYLPVLPGSCRIACESFLYPKDLKEQN
jgi:hypothetical protein